MKLGKFINQFKAGDIARNNMYEVTMSLHHPQIQQEFITGSGFDMDDLRFMVSTTSLPGKSLGVSESRRFGAIDHVANDVIVDTLSMTIYCSVDMRERRFFEGWINYISGKGVFDTKESRYRFRYHDEYISRINIATLNRNGDVAAGCTLTEAFPTNIGPVELAWSDGGSFASFTVTMAFKDCNTIE